MVSFGWGLLLDAHEVAFLPLLVPLLHPLIQAYAVGELPHGEALLLVSPSLLHAEDVLVVLLPVVGWIVKDEEE